MNTAITRGKILAARLRGGRTLAEVQMFDGETRSRVEVLLPMGMTAVPRAGADVVVLEVGNRDHLVALLADDPALRVSGLGPGEIGLRDERGQQVTLTPDGVRVTNALKVTVIAEGDVRIETPANVEIVAPLTTVDGNLTVTGGLAVQGNGGANSTLNGDLTMTGTFVLDGITQNTHRHTGVQPGGGTSGGPVN
ncbi:phage baseplate assembly protein V [Roseomonas alkaliterrae]|jgi:phage baseplate assembly protein V|uniref:phage baseplate assembly protein V n=1 Tax=Neoroseomonas alkaliterrae TaxID=1452450 RepID=UPI001BA8E473|nr:phage baseplate assembly protein V [Neoroseomonas alkaliterrae]MBR0675430.1 phage baseplate assembly protein V [Neoroseomonas alkaliterrae]